MDCCEVHGHCNIHPKLLLCEVTYMGWHKTCSMDIKSTLFMQIVLVIVICPFNITYWSSRFFFIQCLFRCICAPLYKVIEELQLNLLATQWKHGTLHSWFSDSQVTLPDFFLADQLTSQVLYSSHAFDQVQLTNLCLFWFLL